MVIHSASPPDVGASPTKEEWVAKNGSAERSSAIRVSGAHLALFEARGFQSQIGPARQEFNKLLTWGAAMFTRTVLAFVLALLVALPATAQDYKRGQEAYHRGDFKTALREWWPLAERGNARSQYSVGVLLDRGQGVPQNYAEAARWYRKAAEQGYSSAQYNLAHLFRRGLGVPQDYAKAATWFRKAAQQDHTKAVEWYRKAAEQGQANAQHNLDFMQKKGRSAPRKAALATARGDFRVQLGAVRSKARAVKEAKRLISLHKRTLGRLTIVPVRADLGSRGVYYRLRMGPFPDRATADSLCRKLSAGKQRCFVIKP